MQKIFIASMFVSLLVSQAFTGSVEYWYDGKLRSIGGQDVEYRYDGKMKSIGE